MAHTVAVTGGSGFVATELIKQLLAKGYNVRATVRSTTGEKVKPLIKLAEALPGEAAAPVAAPALPSLERQLKSRAAPARRRHPNQRSLRCRQRGAGGS
jgi:nucleoside-diphosphate-sugar epimerase